jgi:hypothetical protein
MLIEYVRNSKREPIGCVVAIDRDSIGVSLLNPKDSFDRNLAKRIAIGRAELGVAPEIPAKKEDLFEDAIHRMALRAARYFKEDYANIAT